MSNTGIWTISEMTVTFDILKNVTMTSAEAD